MLEGATLLCVQRYCTSCQQAVSLLPQTLSAHVPTPMKEAMRGCIREGGREGGGEGGIHGLRTCGHVQHSAKQYPLQRALLNTPRLPPLPGVSHGHDGGYEEGLVPYFRDNDDRDGGCKAVEEVVVLLLLIQVLYVIQLQYNMHCTMQYSTKIIYSTFNFS